MQGNRATVYRPVKFLWFNWGCFAKVFSVSYVFSLRFTLLISFYTPTFLDEIWYRLGFGYERAFPEVLMLMVVAS
mgnify:CR=1 FL=1